MINSENLDETRQKRPFMRPIDVVLFVVLILFALGIWFFAMPSEQGRYARVVSHEFDVYIDLSQNQVFSPEGVPTVRIVVQDGRVAFIESDCPDQVCVHSGFLELPGEWAACLPNRVSVTILGDGVDIIAR